MVRSDPAWRGGKLRAGPRTAPRPAARAQARHDHLSLAGGMGAALRPPARAGDGGHCRAISGRSSRSRPTSSTRRSGSRTRSTRTAYLYLSRAMDQFDLAEHGGGSLAAAFARFGVQRSLVLGVETDMLFPIEQQREIAEHLRAAGAIGGVPRVPVAAGPRRVPGRSRPVRAGDRRIPAGSTVAASDR